MPSFSHSRRSKSNFDNSVNPRTNSAQLEIAPGPWNTPIIASPVLHARSSFMAECVTNREGLTWPVSPSTTTTQVHYLNFWNFGAPVYFVTNADATITLSTTGQGNPATYNPLKWPTTVGATTPGNDGWISVVDVDRGLMYTSWQAKRTGASAWTCSNVGFFNYPLTADGATPLQGIGAGAGHAFGVGAITNKEITDGVIPHALFAHSWWSGATFLYPASKSDGFPVADGNELIEGVRGQLVPTYTYPGGYTPSKGINAIIECLKTYGFYIGDVGDRNLGLVLRGEDLADSGRSVPASGSNLGGDCGNAGRQNGVYWNAFNMTATGRASDFFGELNYFGGTAWPSNLWNTPANFRFLNAWNGV